MIPRIPMATAAALVALAGAASAQQPPASPERRVRGVIVEVAGSTFTVKTADGQAVKVQLADKARVASVAGAPAPPSTMTNANVAKVSKDAGGLTLLLTYPAGQQTAVVAAGTPVVRLSPADRSLLVPGARAFAAGPAGPDGTVSATRVFAGVGGAEPPM